MRLDDAFLDAEKTAHSGAIGLVVSVKGALARVRLFGADVRTELDQGAAQIGALIRIETQASVVYGMIASLDSPSLPQNAQTLPIRIADVEFIGERKRGADGQLSGFRRGVSVFPSLGGLAEPATREDLQSIFDIQGENTITVGTVFQDASLPAKIRVNELLGKHFAILGTTGTGKSCTVALLLQSLLERCPHAHILLLDAHAEYAAAFGDRADVMTHRDLRIPFWVLTFEELVEVLITDKQDYKAEIEMLAELVRQAKSSYAPRSLSGEGGRARATSAMGVSEDAPVRYNLQDLLNLIDERMGRLDHQQDVTLYRRLRNRIDARMRDERYAFMFSPEAAATELSEVFSRLFRVPVAGKPLAILELSGLPSEVLSVIVSVTSRLAFDFGVRSGGDVPITYVCEEAHKYMPADPKLGFQPARRSIARVAKEGRKYGVSLGIITQRPSDLDPTILSQCNTLISMRLTNEEDQSFVRAAVSDGASGLVSFLPSLAPGEAIAFGEGVALPLRLKFRMLEDGRRPASMSANFADLWSKDWANEAYAAEIADRFCRNAPGHDGDTRALLARQLKDRDPAVSPAEAETVAPGPAVAGTAERSIRREPVRKEGIRKEAIRREPLRREPARADAGDRGTTIRRPTNRG